VTIPEVRLVVWQGPLTGRFWWQAYSLLAGRTPLAVGGPAPTRADALAAGCARYPDAVEATTVDLDGWLR
jgi:hypothetical protein